MNQATTSILSDTRYDPGYFGPASPADKSLTQAGRTAMAIPLFSAALSLLCLVTICFIQEPWFAAAGFAAAYSFFWVSLSNQGNI
jgi:hypothetical protein